MSVRNRAGINIESAKSDLEATIEMKLDDIKSEHVKNTNSLDIKYQLSHQTNHLYPMNNHLLISPNGHS